MRLVLTQCYTKCISLEGHMPYSAPLTHSIVKFVIPSYFQLLNNYDNFTLAARGRSFSFHVVYVSVLVMILSLAASQMPPNIKCYVALSTWKYTRHFQLMWQSMYFILNMCEIITLFKKIVIIMRDHIQNGLGACIAVLSEVMVIEA
jgi:hypothetical protein